MRNITIQCPYCGTDITTASDSDCTNCPNCSSEINLLSDDQMIEVEQEARKYSRKFKGTQEGFREIVELIYIEVWKHIYGKKKDLT